MSALAGVEVGQQLPGFSRTFTRADLVRYAGASGDFNPIHWSNPAAAALGLPDVIAHGMLTMGTALRVVTDWAGDPARVRSYYVRFTKPVVVPEVGGTVVHVRRHGDQGGRRPCDGERRGPLRRREGARRRHRRGGPWLNGWPRTRRSGSGDRHGRGSNPSPRPS